MENICDTFRKNLIDLLKSTNTNQNELAKYLKVSPAAVNNWTRGQNVPRLDKIDQICFYFGVDRNDFLNDMKKGYKIPFFETLDAGVSIDTIKNCKNYIDDIPKNLDGDVYFALKVKGQAMEPELHEGDIVIVRIQPDVEDGQIGIVAVDGEAATCRLIMHKNDGIILVGYNSIAYPPHFYTKEEIRSLPIKVIGRVVEVRRKY